VPVHAITARSLALKAFFVSSVTGGIVGQSPNGRDKKCDVGPCPYGRARIGRTIGRFVRSHGVSMNSIASDRESGTGLDVVFLFFYPSRGDTFRFPALSACCSGEVIARGLRSRVVEVQLDIDSPAETDLALKLLSDFLRAQSPKVVVCEEVPFPGVFDVIRKACDASIVYPFEADPASAHLIDFKVFNFQSNPAPLVELVTRLANGREPDGIPNVSVHGRPPATLDAECGRPPLFLADPDYDFVSIPACARQASRRLSVYVNPGCPWSADVADNPHYSGVTFAIDGVARRGCSFCFQDGRYSGLDAEATVTRILLELVRWLGLHPECREVVLWDESPWRFLGLLVERLASSGMGPMAVCFHARCDHLVRQVATITDACLRARQFADSGISLVLTLVGFENYSAPELERMNKGYGPPILSQAAAVCRSIADQYPDVFEYDRYRASSFILFTPWTLVSDLRANIDGFRRDGIEEFSTGMGLSRLRLYPNLPITALADSDGLARERATGDAENLAGMFGYSFDIPWRFRDGRVEQVFRLYRALYPLVERRWQVDLLEWCVNAVVSGDSRLFDPPSAASVFLRLNAALAALNSRGRGTARKPESVVAAGATDPRAESMRTGTLELILTGRGVPDGRNLPDTALDPSPARLAVKISRAADAVSRLHVLGREPTLSPIFLRAVYLARQAGVPGASVRTDGLVFSQPAALARAIKAGLTDIEIRVFGTSDEDWRRATGGRGGIDAFLAAASLVASSSAAIGGRALVQIGTVNPDSIPQVVSMLDSVGLRQVSFEAPVSCLPVSGLESFVREIERLVQSSSPVPASDPEVGIDNGNIPD